jgi:hypothetical protein
MYDEDAGDSATTGRDVGFVAAAGLAYARIHASRITACDNLESLPSPRRFRNFTISDVMG